MILLFLIVILSLLLSCSSEEKRLPIVYAFTVVPAVCPLGLPTYIQVMILLLLLESLSLIYVHIFIVGEFTTSSIITTR